MKPVALKFCPQCGSVGYQFRDDTHWFCPVCLFTYYHNVATSASVIVEIDGAIMMLERNINPGKGLYSLPGGFVGNGERAEEAAARECREETGLIPVDLTYVGSWPNEYVYRNVAYRTCDFYFVARVEGGLSGLALEPSEVAGLRLVSPESVDSAPIAFESHRLAIKAWLSGRAERG